jgi:hypothetical protein
MLRNSWVAERLAASQEVLGSMELVSQSLCWQVLFNSSDYCQRQNTGTVKGDYAPWKRLWVVPQLRRLVAVFPQRSVMLDPKVRSCGICSGQSGTRPEFLQILRFTLPILIPPIFIEYHIIRRYTVSILTASLNKKLQKDVHAYNGVYCQPRQLPLHLPVSSLYPLHILRMTSLVADLYNLVPFFPLKKGTRREIDRALRGIYSESSSLPPWRHHCDATVPCSFLNRCHCNETGDMTSLYRWRGLSGDRIHPLACTSTSSTDGGSVWSLIFLTTIPTLYFWKRSRPFENVTETSHTKKHATFENCDSSPSSGILSFELTRSILCPHIKR